MRLALVISSLRQGGAERVFSLTANALAARGHQVTLFTLENECPSPFYPLAESVCHLPLKLAKKSSNYLAALGNNLRRVTTLRRAILSVRPEAVLSFMDATNILVLMAVGRDLPVAVSERVHPVHYDIGPIWRNLRRATYSRAAAIVIQTADIQHTLPAVLRPRCAVIPNPVVKLPNVTPVPNLITQGRLLLAMGRLASQKGFDMLLQAFAPIAQDHPDWTLVILGEGPERPSLESLREELCLNERVLLPGQLDAPGWALRRADLFVLSSRFEGFPNALCEAMACGLPAVAFDCPSGPRDIIRHGMDGLLVRPGNVKELTDALSRIMSNEKLRHSFAKQAPNILERFGLEKVMDMWENLLIRIAKGYTGP
ncbi:MAG: glycosyltransferase family 4 protein [Pseudomonadota bacterium]